MSDQFQSNAEVQNAIALMEQTMNAAVSVAFPFVIVEQVFDLKLVDGGTIAQSMVVATNRKFYQVNLDLATMRPTIVAWGDAPAQEEPQGQPPQGQPPQGQPQQPPRQDSSDNPTVLIDKHYPELEVQSHYPINPGEGICLSKASEAYYYQTLENGMIALVRLEDEQMKGLSDQQKPPKPKDTPDAQEDTQMQARK